MRSSVFFCVTEISFIADPDEDAAVLLTSHADCIWDMSTHNVLPLIASASADGTCCVRNWSKSADSAESVVQTLGAHGT